MSMDAIATDDGVIDTVLSMEDEVRRVLQTPAAVELSVKDYHAYFQTTAQATDAISLKHWQAITKLSCMSLGDKTL